MGKKRYRPCVKAVREELKISERRACRILEHYRSTQRQVEVVKLE